MSHFSWKKYNFAANCIDKLTFLIFDVKQRLIWHSPWAESFLSGGVHEAKEKMQVNENL